jgi:uncharacterized protein YndB with AHSA1/START domain
MANANKGAARARNPLIISAPPGERIIRMSREFDFPRQLVWDVYSDGPSMARWWGPSKYDTVVHQFDFRKGGKWRVDNVTRDGKEVHPFHGEFVDIQAPNEFTWTFGYADFPPGTETYRFIDLGGRTRLEAESVFETVEARDAIAAGGMEAGAIETYNRLDDHLDLLSKTSNAERHGFKPIKAVRFVRVVNAPRQLVFDVWTQPEHLARWFSPQGFKVEGVESDPRPGGVFKLIMVPEGGGGFWSVGNYLEVEAPRKIVTRVGGEDADGKVMFEVINTAIFEEQGPKTVVYAAGEVISINDPEVGKLAMSGMEEGWKQTLDRFEARLAAVVER